MVDAGAVDSDTVGWKAYGLACLPPAWGLPFGVISAEYACLEARLQSNKALVSFMAAAGIPVAANLIVRSSGCDETLDDRGSLESATCGMDSVFRTIRELIKNLKPGQRHRVHWVVQPHLEARIGGHFSNERRFRQESRDWVVEAVPPDGRSSYVSTKAVRPWRDGRVVGTEPLLSQSEPGVSVALKRVAMWATRFGPRLHFEWLWDGKTVWLVQADAETYTGGVSPASLLPKHIAPAPIDGLTVFRKAAKADFEGIRKLANAKLYSGLGYRMPPFYVLSDPTTIAAIRGGHVSPELESDLTRLLARPLVLRTDGSEIPSSSREMLPRSDELRTLEGAKQWLLEALPEKLREAGLERTPIVLIGHHFIPSVASAWVRAEPGKPMVRVECLWGIPEGLYWLSHDTIEVDTGAPVLDVSKSAPPRPARIVKKQRFKGTFIAPDEEGRWTAHRTAPPADWRVSINSSKWLAEVAWTTRRIAEVEKSAVSVMWFIANHPDATPHQVLPWWHIKWQLGDTPKAAPPRKYRTSVDAHIRTSADWDSLLAEIASGTRIERVVVEPTDPALIRNPGFAKRLAEVAAANSIVVELSGGILSHAYYMLVKAGARVECVDLFGGDEETIEFEKLVRDKVVDAIEKRGEKAVTAKLEGDALVQALRRKLVEEALEALDAAMGDDIVGELADVLEVARRLGRALGFSDEDLEEARLDKAEKRGGFEKGTMLLRTASPGTATGNRNAGAEHDPLTPKGRKQVRFSKATELPVRPIQRRPDTRHPDVQAIEKLLTLELDFDRLNGLREGLAFQIPPGTLETQRFLLQVHAVREGGAVRLSVSVRMQDTQLELESPSDQLHLFAE